MIEGITGAESGEAPANGHAAVPSKRSGYARAKSRILGLNKELDAAKIERAQLLKDNEFLLAELAKRKATPQAAGGWKERAAQFADLLVANRDQAGLRAMLGDMVLLQARVAKQLSGG